MSRLTITVAIAALFAGCAAPALAQDYTANGRVRPYIDSAYLRYDGRGDTRDFPNNGFFPGDFAAHPSEAWLGAAGVFGTTGQVAGGPQFYKTACVRYRRADGTLSRCHLR